MAISRDKVLRTAEKLVQKGKIEQAIHEYEKLLQSNPNDANTINRVGDLYGRIGRVEDAIALYEKIAEYFTQDGFTAKAIAILKKINRLAPQRVDIFERLAELYLKQNLVVEAKNQYEMLAQWFEKQGDTKNAIRIQKKLLELEPGNYPIRLHLADALMKVGEHEEAMNEYTILGKLLLDKGKLDEADRLYNHILDLKPADGTFLEPVIDALIAAKRHAEAKKLLGRGIELLPQDAVLNKLSAKILLASGEFKKARVRAEGALAEHPDDENLQILAGRAAAAAGDADRARELLLPIIDGLLKRGEFQKSQPLLDALLVVEPDSLDVLKRAIQAANLSGDRPKALVLKRQLAAGYRKAGMTNEALRLYNEISRLDPKDQVARKAIAELSGVEAPGAAESSEPGFSSVDLTEEAPELSPEEVEWSEVDAGDTRSGLSIPASAPVQASEQIGFDPEERLAEANVFAKYGLEDKAIRHLQDILDFFPAMHEAREKLVTLYLGQGKRDEAREIAGPLLEFYRETGEREKAEALAHEVGGIGEPVTASQVEPEEAVEFEIEGPGDVLFVDLEDELTSEEPVVPVEVPSVEAAESVASAEPAAPVEAATPPGDITPAEVVEAAETDALEREEGLNVPEGQEQGAVEHPARHAESVAASFGVEELLEQAVPNSPVSESGAGIPDHANIFAELDELEQTLRAGDHHVRQINEPGKPSLVSFEGLREEPAIPVAAQEEAPAVEVSAGAAAEENSVPEAGEMPIEELGVEELVDVSGAVEGPPVVVLQQIDFFIEQGLFEDALRLLSGLEMDFPDDPDVAKRRLVLKERGIIVEEPIPAEAEDTSELFAEEEGYVDLAQELEAELAEEEALVEEATGEGQDEAILDEVFKEFRRGVAEQLSEEDSDTHYNLGLAYKEMGLFPEAIGEFEIASKDPNFYLECCSMIAICYVEQGLFDQAASWYRRALEIEDLPRPAQLALMYDLASVLESAGDDIQALDLYSQVAELDPGYRDVGERLQGLQQQRNVN